ncbi:response regulator transcription factor [Cohnella herbarum]|uniref:Response regulator n=1 Tax=Cohnella herbarum TaxID=2728023 RepID=A0A7Z2ZNQ4_9BACL|nr:response regulator [Cohnella herbarum]QJD86691.1 response regulator [Cohnella herbarum]
MRVLIIEDEPKVRRALKRLLLDIEPSIESIREAETGLDGLAAVQEETPDLILLDIIMPEMNGNELLERIRALKLETPVIVISGHNDFGFVKHALSNEAVEYLLKPFDREDIETALLKAKDRMDKNRFQRQTERLWEEMKKEKSQLHRVSVLSNLYEGRKLTGDELALLPKFAREDSCGVHTIILKNYDRALQERFHKDKDLLAYAIIKLIAEYEEQQGITLLFGPSGRYDWCYWLITPASVPSATLLKGFQDAFETVLKLACFAISAEGSKTIADYSPTIAMLEDTAFYTDIHSLESGSTGNSNEWRSRAVSTPELQALVTAFVPKACHLIKHGLAFRIRGELDELFEAASSSRCLSAMFLFQAWTMLLTQVGTEFGFRVYGSESLDRVEPFAMKIAFDKTKAMELFEECLNFFMNTASALRGETASGSRALAVKEYIDICYREEMSLADLAERFFISKEYLASRFKRQFGVTVVHYIHSRRLDTARRMLEEEGLSVSAIASAVGYDHFSYFDKLFKREYGSTPSEYRTLSAKAKVD